MHHFRNLILTSSGIRDSPSVRSMFESGVGGSRFAAVVTTASPEYKERNKHAVATRQTLREFGFKGVDFVDVEFEDASVLSDYDLVYIVGGNPFYLMDHLKRSGADAILREIIKAEEAILIGSSAGAVVLGPDLRIVAEFDPDLAEGYEDFAGVGIVPFTILPHVNRWREKLPDLDDRLHVFHEETGLRVELLADGGALFLTPDDLKLSSK